MIFDENDMKKTGDIIISNLDAKTSRSSLTNSPNSDKEVKLSNLCIDVTPRNFQSKNNVSLYFIDQTNIGKPTNSTKDPPSNEENSSNDSSLTDLKKRLQDLPATNDVARLTERRRIVHKRDTSYHHQSEVDCIEEKDEKEVKKQQSSTGLNETLANVPRLKDARARRRARIHLENLQVENDRSTVISQSSAISLSSSKNSIRGSAEEIDVHSSEGNIEQSQISEVEIREDDSKDSTMFYSQRSTFSGSLSNRSSCRSKDSERGKESHESKVVTSQLCGYHSDMCHESLSAPEANQQSISPVTVNQITRPTKFGGYRPSGSVILKNLSSDSESETINDVAPNDNRKLCKTENHMIVNNELHYSRSQANNNEIKATTESLKIPVIEDIPDYKNNFMMNKNDNVLETDLISPVKSDDSSQSIVLTSSHSEQSRAENFTTLKEVHHQSGNENAFLQFSNDEPLEIIIEDTSDETQPERIGNSECYNELMSNHSINIHKRKEIRTNRSFPISARTDAEGVNFAAVSTNSKFVVECHTVPSTPKYSLGRNDVNCKLSLPYEFPKEKQKKYLERSPSFLTGVSIEGGGDISNKSDVENLSVYQENYMINVPKLQIYSHEMSHSTSTGSREHRENRHLDTEALMQALTNVSVRLNSIRNNSNTTTDRDPSFTENEVFDIRKSTDSLQSDQNLQTQPNTIQEFTQYSDVSDNFKTNRISPITRSRIPVKIAKTVTAFPHNTPRVLKEAYEENLNTNFLSPISTTYPNMPLTPVVPNNPNTGRESKEKVVNAAIDLIESKQLWYSPTLSAQSNLSRHEEGLNVDHEGKKLSTKKMDVIDVNEKDASGRTSRVPCSSPERKTLNFVDNLQYPSPRRVHTEDQESSASSKGKSQIIENISWYKVAFQNEGSLANNRNYEAKEHNILNSCSSREFNDSTTQNEHTRHQNINLISENAILRKNDDNIQQVSIYPDSLVEEVQNRVSVEHFRVKNTDSRSVRCNKLNDTANIPEEFGNYCTYSAVVIPFNTLPMYEYSQQSWEDPEVNCNFRSPRKGVTLCTYRSDDTDHEIDIKDRRQEKLTNDRKENDQCFTEPPLNERCTTNTVISMHTPKLESTIRRKEIREGEKTTKELPTVTYPKTLKTVQSENVIHLARKSRETYTGPLQTSSSISKLQHASYTTRYSPPFKRKSQDRFPFTISENTSAISPKCTIKSKRDCYKENQDDEKAIRRLDIHPSLTRLATSGFEDTPLDIINYLSCDQRKGNSSFVSRVKGFVRKLSTRCKRSRRKTGDIETMLRKTEVIYQNKECRVDSTMDSYSGTSSLEGSRWMVLDSMDVCTDTRSSIISSGKSLKKKPSCQDVATNTEQPRRRYDRDGLWVRELQKEPMAMRRNVKKSLIIKKNTSTQTLNSPLSSVHQRGLEDFAETFSTLSKVETRKNSTTQHETDLNSEEINVDTKYGCVCFRLCRIINFQSSKTRSKYRSMVNADKS